MFSWQEQLSHSWNIFLLLERKTHIFSSPSNIPLSIFFLRSCFKNFYLVFVFFCRNYWTTASSNHLKGYEKSCSLGCQRFFTVLCPHVPPLSLRERKDLWHPSYRYKSRRNVSKWYWSFVIRMIYLWICDWMWSDEIY